MDQDARCRGPRKPRPWWSPATWRPARRTDISAIDARDYLVAFEEELAKAADSAALIAAMTRRYPNAGMGVALQIGAKVAKGEMKWG